MERKITNSIRVTVAQRIVVDISWIPNTGVSSSGTIELLPPTQAVWREILGPKTRSQFVTHLYGLLPCLVFETETCCVFGNGALDVVGDAFREIGGDLHADFHGGMRVTGEDADDLLGDLQEAHFCRRGIHFGGTDEDVGLRWHA